MVAIEPKGLRGFVMTVHPFDADQISEWASNGLLHYINDKASSCLEAIAIQAGSHTAALGSACFLFTFGVLIET